VGQEYSERAGIEIRLIIATLLKNENTPWHDLNAMLDESYTKSMEKKRRIVTLAAPPKIGEDGNRRKAIEITLKIDEDLNSEGTDEQIKLRVYCKKSEEGQLEIMAIVKIGKERGENVKKEGNDKNISLRDVGLNCSIPIKNKEGFELDYVVRQNGKVFALRHLEHEIREGGYPYKIRDFVVYEVSEKGEEVFIGGLYYVIPPMSGNTAFSSTDYNYGALTKDISPYVFYVKEDYAGQKFGKLLLSAAVKYMIKKDEVKEYEYVWPTGNSIYVLESVLPDYTEKTGTSAFLNEQSGAIFKEFRKETQTITIADWLRDEEGKDINKKTTDKNVSLEEFGFSCSIPIKNKEGFELDYVVRQNKKVFALRHLETKKDTGIEEFNVRDFGAYEITKEGEEIFVGGIYYVIFLLDEKTAITSVEYDYGNLKNNMKAQAFYVEDAYRGQLLGTLLLSLAVRYMKKKDKVRTYRYEMPMGKSEDILGIVLPDYNAKSEVSVFAGEKSDEIFKRFQQETQTITIADWLRDEEEKGVEEKEGETNPWGSIRVNGFQVFAKVTDNPAEITKTLDKWFENAEKRSFPRNKWEIAIEEAAIKRKKGFLAILETEGGKILGISYCHKGIFPFEEGDQSVYMGDYSEISEEHRGKGLGEILLAKRLERILDEYKEGTNREEICVIHPAEDKEYAPEEKRAEKFFYKHSFDEISFPGFELFTEEAKESNRCLAITAYSAQRMVDKTKEKIERPRGKMPGKQMSLFPQVPKQMNFFPEQESLTKKDIETIRKQRNKKKTPKKETKKEQLSLFGEKEGEKEEKISKEDLEKEKEIIENTNLRGKNVLNCAGTYFKNINIKEPVDIVIDTTLIPREDLEDNTKIWAGLIRSCKDLKNVNFIFALPNFDGKGTVPRIMTNDFERAPPVAEIMKGLEKEM
ncbi:MAG: hypothetical protein ABH862_00005, partial [Candidatus Omnitrophota bacterium]